MSITHLTHNRVQLALHTLRDAGGPALLLLHGLGESAPEEVPGFAATQVDEGLRVIYTSRRKLCALAEGLILGGGEFYGHELEVTHESCVHEGHATCTMFVRDTLVDDTAN